MSEMVKTLIYVGVALLLAVTAWVWQPRTAELKVNKMVGSKLFGNFKNADEATSLTITRYDDKFGKPVKFQIARDAGSQQWVIPSEDNYPVAVPDSGQPDNPIGPMGQPAGSQTQMQKAATALIGLEILGVASEKRNDHELFGVVEPSSKAKAKPEEIGMLVEVTGDKQSKLADLVIGKAVADNNEQRFVRVRGQDVTYVVKIDMASFTTELSKWIEADLLALSPFDIRSVALKDYSILEVLDPRTNRPVKQLMQRSDTALSWNQEESKWSIRHMLEYKTATQPTPTELAENEELNSDRLNELKNALDDLKIVGVKQKPADSNQTKLMEYGYYPFSTVSPLFSLPLRQWRSSRFAPGWNPICPAIRGHRSVGYCQLNCREFLR
ncbi:MAG TPA: DUF4340 domain-containing protein [Planctomycetaceae bacterium]|nr:DUF4340 domain-containing protein [Planctomycetaceae bacterium]